LAGDAVAGGPGEVRRGGPSRPVVPDGTAAPRLRPDGGGNCPAGRRHGTGPGPGPAGGARRRQGLSRLALAWSPAAVGRTKGRSRESLPPRHRGGAIVGRSVGRPGGSPGADGPGGQGRGGTGRRPDPGGARGPGAGTGPLLRKSVATQGSGVPLRG